MQQEPMLQRTPSSQQSCCAALVVLMLAVLDWAHSFINVINLEEIFYGNYSWSTSLLALTAGIMYGSRWMIQFCLCVWKYCASLPHLQDRNLSAAFNLPENTGWFVALTFNSWLMLGFLCVDGQAYTTSKIKSAFEELGSNPHDWMIGGLMVLMAAKTAVSLWANISAIVEHGSATLLEMCSISLLLMHGVIELFLFLLPKLRRKMESWSRAALTVFIMLVDWVNIVCCVIVFLPVALDDDNSSSSGASLDEFNGQFLTPVDAATWAILSVLVRLVLHAWLAVWAWRRDRNASEEFNSGDRPTFQAVTFNTA
eukprot:COSAG01_NODE_9698_length_2366_cov_870.599912_2_plen_311_part_01